MILTQENLARYKFLDLISKRVQEEMSMLKTSFKDAIQQGELPEAGDIQVALKYSEKASLSKDKVVSAFSKYLTLQTITECLNSIPKSPVESLPVDYKIPNSPSEVEIKLKSEEVVLHLNKQILENNVSITPRI